MYTGRGRSDAVLPRPTTWTTIGRPAITIVALWRLLSTSLGESWFWSCCWVLLAIWGILEMLDQVPGEDAAQILRIALQKLRQTVRHSSLFVMPCIAKHTKWAKIHVVSMRAEHQWVEVQMAGIDVVRPRVLVYLRGTASTLYSSYQGKNVQAFAGTELIA